MEFVRPYLAAFAARFQLTLQYRAAALAGFATQCWWGGIKIMVYAAFFSGTRGGQPISLADTITYTWLAQAFLAFQPWNADPDVADAVRSGAIAYDRLRPLDTYGWWYARATAWTVARVLPRAVLMFTAASLIMPILGLGAWSLKPPPSPTAGLLFVASMAGVIALSGAMVALLDVIVAATLSDRGVNLLMAPIAGVLSGMIVPLAFFPQSLQPFLALQPFAGLVDTPFRIYLGESTGAVAAAGIALQFGWAFLLVMIGRASLGRAMRRLQVQGG
jgi:ABC-2 type transport system permease protein